MSNYFRILIVSHEKTHVDNAIDIFSLFSTSRLRVVAPNGKWEIKGHVVLRDIARTIFRRKFEWFIFHVIPDDLDRFGSKTCSFKH